MMPGKQHLISAVNLPTQKVETFQALSAKKITAVAWDYIKDETNIYPVVRAMGEIAGNTSVLIAAEYLSHSSGGQGLMFGGISGVKPTEVVILGAGTVAEFAVRAALGLGASVKVFDNSTYKLRRLQNDIGQRLWTSTIQPSELRNALDTADVAIGAMHARHGRTPVVVTDDMVSNMKYGSVIVDISIDQGGCFETSHPTTHAEPTDTVEGVVHYCVANMPGAAPRTSSEALVHATLPFGLALADHGLNALARDKHLARGLNVLKGELTHPAVAQALGKPFADPYGAWA
jgi:alanine dehydrogenase